MNERTHFFIKIYPSHFILERVAKGLMLVVCERWVGDGERLLFGSQVLTIAALLPHLGWGCSTVGYWGPKALCLPLALNTESCLQLTPICSNRLGHLPASAVLQLLYTGASLDWRLGRGSICYTFWAFEYCFECTNYDWYHRHFYGTEKIGYLFMV